MAFKRRLSLAFQEMEEAGIARGNYLPPVYGLLLRFGLERPPPHYCPMSQNLLFSATWFAPVWGVVMWLMVLLQTLIVWHQRLATAPDTRGASAPFFLKYLFLVYYVN